MILSSLALAKADGPMVALFGTYFGQINQHLSHTVSTDNMAENFAEAANWLQAVEAEKYSIMRRGLIRGLRLFLSLETLDLELRCDLSSYGIIKSNNKAVGDQARSDKLDLEHADRIAYIVYMISYKHANSCLPVYASNFQQLLTDPYFVDQLNRVNDLMGGLLKHYGGQNRFMLIGPESAQIFYETLKSAAKHDPNKECLVSNKGLCKGKAKQMIQDYLIKPCKMLLAQAESIFVPYKYDKIWIEQQDLVKLEYEHFRRASSYYGLCQTLIDRDYSYVTEDILALVKKASEQSVEHAL